MFCPNCGANIPDDSVFCGNCGTKIEAVPVAPAVAPQPKNTTDGATVPPPTTSQAILKENKKKKNPLPFIMVVIVLVIVIAGTAKFLKKGREARLSGVGKTTTSTEGTTAKTIETGKETPTSTLKTSETSVSVSLDTTGIDGIEDIPGGRSLEEMKAISDKLSTTTVPNYLDFEWLFDLDTDTGEGQADFLRNGEAEKIMYEENPLLNGGWGGILLDTFSKPYDPIVIRYFTVDVDTKGGDFAMDVAWNQVFFPHDGTTFEDNDTVSFTGTWDAVTGTASLTSDYYKVEFDNFYLSEDECAEIATGTFYWNTGEVERIGLIRYNR